MTVEDDPSPDTIKETKTQGGFMKQQETTANKQSFERIAKEPTAVFFDVTPEIAQEMLEHNTNNRSLRRRRVTNLAKEMSRKQWLTTGEAIKFDVKGVLIDGQHRLEGCVEAKITLKQQLVVTGLPEESFAVIDSGMKRTNTDVLNAAGIANASAISPVARLYGVIDAGLNPYRSDVRSLITRQDVVTWSEENIEVLDWAVRLARTVYDAAGIGNRTALITLAVLADKKGHSRAKVEEFFAALGSGSGLSGHSPILALRSWFIKSGMKLGADASTIHLANCVNTFNSWCQGKVVRRYSALGPSHDMPTLVEA